MCRQTLGTEVPEAGKPALSCRLNRSDVLHLLTHCQLSPLLQTRPSDPQLMCRHDNSESGCAVQSSTLSDGTVALQRSSPGSAAAHFSIGVAEHSHRQSHAIAAHHPMRARRQDNVRSAVLHLHQVLVRPEQLPRLGGGTRGDVGFCCVRIATVEGAGNHIAYMTTASLRATATMALR